MKSIAPAGAYPARETIEGELGIGIRAEFIRKPSGLWWAKIRLPAHRFTNAWACCAGETKASALSSAIIQARRCMKAVA